MIWNTLLQLHEQLRIAGDRGKPVANTAKISISPHDGCETGVQLCNTVDIDFSQNGDPSLFYLELNYLENQAKSLSLTFAQPFHYSTPAQHSLSVHEEAELALYLPYALLPWFARQHGRSFAISHFAQTLDGRIAASSGDSKWIGNKENLNHAHKMRALCDAILVGSSTLRADQPQLSVRHVNGRNPLRIILGNNCSEEDIAVENTGPLLWINTTRNDNNLEQLTLSEHNGKINCGEILAALHQRGIYSVYIEGGATTTSHFIQSAALDQVQIHLSAKILGSGITGFNFSGIENMQDAVNFSNPRFVDIGNEVMFVGELLH